MGNVSPTPRQLLIEAVVFWSIAVVLFIGSPGQLELALPSACLIIYTGLLILIQISARHGTNLFPFEDYDQIISDPQQVKDRIFGSKIVIGLEQCMLFSTWGVKICMLTLFWRLTVNIRFLHLYVKLIAIYVAVGFVVIMVTYYTVYCRPFQQYWQLPVVNMQCATYQHYSITQAVFNISSDAAMLAVPIPLLMKTQLRARRKIILVCIMSLGVFTIVAAILNKIFNFASPLTTTYQIWYIREASTAIYVANLICLWPLLRKLFGLKAFKSSNKQYRQHGAQHNKESPGASQSALVTANNLQSRLSFALQRPQFSILGGRQIFQKLLLKRRADELHANQETMAERPSSYWAPNQKSPHRKWDNEGVESRQGDKIILCDLEAGTIENVNPHSSLKLEQEK